jgi:hypothetical protein
MIGSAVNERGGCDFPALPGSPLETKEKEVFVCIFRREKETEDMIN